MSWGADWTPGANAWLERKLRAGIPQCLRGYKKARHQSLADSQHAVDWLVRYYLKHREKAVRWSESDWYNPDADYAYGTWIVDWERLDTDLYWNGVRRYLEVERAEDEAAACPNLEAWLSRLHRKQLRTRPHHERSAWSLLSGTSERERYAAMRRKLLATWPKICRDCGDEFREGAGGPRHCVRCAACRAARRAKA